MAHPLNRAASFLPSLVVAFSVAASAPACGQVTGLSDDYVFDLIDGGDSNADGSKPDGAPADAAADTPDAAKCSAAAIAAALEQLNQGSTSCKACLAQSCCTDVEACVRNQDCKRTLECKLDCTTKNASERSQCSKGCNGSGGGLGSVYTSGVGACGSAGCTTECGL